MRSSTGSLPPSPSPADGPWGYPALTGRAPLLVLAGGLLLLVWPGSLFTGCLIVASAIVVLLALDLIVAPRPGTIGVQRALPATLALGSTGEVTWTVTNPHRRPVWVSMADQLAPSLGASARRATVAVPSGRSVTLRSGLAPTRRGLFSPRSLVIRARGPLGLVARQATRDLPGEIRIYPNFGPRRQAELLIDRARTLEVGLRSARARGGATDFDQLREYSVDDDARRIDWAATARADRPIVRAYRSEQNQRVISLIDNGRSMAGQLGGVARVEHAIDAVMMLTSVAARIGDMPGLVAFDREVRAVVPPRSGRGQLREVTEALYRLQPVLVESDYRGAFNQVLSRFQRRAMLCLVTELEEALVDSLLPSLSIIARTHLLLVGSVRDPGVVTWAAEVPNEVGKVYRTASALDALARRRELARLISAQGAIVVDAPPGRLAARFTDAYLQAKATGRL